MADDQQDKRIESLNRNACELLINFLHKINKPANRLFTVILGYQFDHQLLHASYCM